MIVIIMRVKKFLEKKGFKVKLNIIYQDNTSTIKLKKNGKLSSGKRIRHFDIKLFYIADLIYRDEVEVRYYPTDGMIGDYMSKSKHISSTRLNDFTLHKVNCISCHILAGSVAPDLKEDQRFYRQL